MNEQNKSYTGRLIPRPYSVMHKQTGAALIVSLLILTLLTLLSTTALRMTSLQEKMARNQKLRTIAEFAAERGVSEAISDLVDESINDSGAGESQTSTTWTETVVPKNDWSPAFLAASKGYDFQYTVKHRLVGGVVAINRYGKPYYHISSTGTSGEASLGLETTVSLNYLTTGGAGLVGCDGVTFNSTANTSSYSSSGAPAHGDLGDIATTNAGADIILTNDSVILGDVRATDELSLMGTAKIERDAYANGAIFVENPGSTSGYIRQDAWSQSSITHNEAANDSLGTDHPNQSGSVVPLQECDPLSINERFSIIAGQPNNNSELNPSYYSTSPRPTYFNNTEPPGWVVPADALIAGHFSDTIGTTGSSKKYDLVDFKLDANSAVRIQGDVTLYLTDEFRMDSNAQLVIDPAGSLTIYIEGKFFLDHGSRVNVGGIPANLLVFSNAADNTRSGPSQAQVELNSNSGFAGVFYAPFAHISTDSESDMYGSLRGRWVDMHHNGEFHYDEDLDAILTFGPPIGYELVSRTQQSFTSW